MKKKIQDFDELLRLVSKREAAAILGVSVRTIEREVSAGRLTKHKVRGSVRFVLGDVMRLGGLLNSNLVAS